MHSLVATICINFTELSPITVPNQKPLLNCKEATDIFLDKDWGPCQRKARLRELFKGKLTSDELAELTLPQIAKIIQTSQFIYEKCKKKSRETRKAAVKNEFIELCEHIFRARQAFLLIFGRPKGEKVPVRAVNSLACKTILSCCWGKVFKSTLMPMFVKRYHEAFLEFDLGLVSSFNISQNQVNSILRGH